MTEIVAAIAGIIGTVIVSFFTYLMARRAGIGPYQDTLVSKLKDLVDLQAKEIEGLQKENSLLKERVDSLEARIDELKELTISQALIINELSPRQRKMLESKLQSKEME